MSSSDAKKLRTHTATMTRLFQSRVSSFKNRPDMLRFLRQLDENKAVTTALNILGQGDWQCIGIDGSMDYDERMQMILFYVAGTGYRCPLKISKEKTSVDLKQLWRDENLSATAAVPIWVEDAAAITGKRPTGETDFDFFYSMEGIPYALMLMAELHLAYLASVEEPIKVILLDRPLSTTFSSILNDLRMLLRLRTSSLIGIKTPKGELSKLDLQLAAVLGSGQRYLPTRGQHLVARAIRELIKGERTRSELASALGFDEDAVEKLAKRLMRFNELEEGLLLEKCDLTGFSVREGVKDYWYRITNVVEQILDKVFRTKGEHPLLLDADKWLTVLDLNAINFFLLLMLVDKVNSTRKLIIGTAKDTMATDLTRAILPYEKWQNNIKTENLYPNVRNDKAFLAILSATNAERLRTPWRLKGYDSCFTTLLDNHDEKIPLRAARKVVASEQLFVKSYFQLRSFKTDSTIRSPIFVYDRPLYPELDRKSTHKFTILERDRPQEIEPFFEDNELSEIDNLVLYLFSLQDNPEVVEAYGYNQLLYLADKAVKARVRSMRGALRGIAGLELSALARRERIFTILSRYRDMRSEREYSRARFAGRG
jgi:hypothetical protein